ncbi:MAG: zinc ribbon domain-containing protein [Thermoplasmata archaeon]
MGTPAGTRRCVSCGREIAIDANVCQYCGHDYRAQAAPPGPKEKSVLSLVGGILILLAGLMGLAMGAMMLAINVEDLEQYGVDVAGLTDMIEGILTACGVIWAILGIIALIGGVFGVMRKHWGLAVLGGVIGLLVIGPYFLGSIFSLIGLILVIVAKKDFE